MYCGLAKKNIRQKQGEKKKLYHRQRSTVLVARVSWPEVKICTKVKAESFTKCSFYQDYSSLCHAELSYYMDKTRVLKFEEKKSSLFAGEKTSFF